MCSLSNTPLKGAVSSPRSGATDPPVHGMREHETGGQWSDFSRTVFGFACVLAATQSHGWPEDPWEFWAQPWQWDKAHALWERLGKPQQPHPMWPRFVYAADTHSEDAALAELEESGTLTPLWWEDDREWSAFTAALAAAGHRYLADCGAPLLDDGEKGLVFRWVLDEPHTAWVELGRPQPHTRGWIEFLIRWRIVSAS